MTILMLILAVIPALIAIINWWNAKAEADPEVLLRASDRLWKINEALAKKKRLGPLEKFAMAQLRRRCEQAVAARPPEGVAALFLEECGTLSQHCQRMGIPAAFQDSDLSDLRSTK